MGDVRTDEHSQPKIIPELQNRSVISVPLGDYHYGALTADGQLLTWGQYSHGALGLGVPTELPLGAPGGYSSESQLSESRRSSWGPLVPPKVAAPSPVSFNHGSNPGGRRFCFAATAAGWHTGALVLCLEVSFPPEDRTVRLMYEFSSLRKRYMTTTPPPKTTNPPPPGLGLDSLDVVMEHHQGARISHPRHTRAHSDLAAEYSGSALRGVGGGEHRGHENNKIAVCLYCTYCNLLRNRKLPCGVIVLVVFLKCVQIRLELQ
jgi:hypothetical protein